jgi:hypothetical protein
MDHVVTTGGRTYRIACDGGDIDAIFEWLTTDHGEPGPLIALSRQQVLARIGRSALPADFPGPDLMIGDPQREAGHTRGWLESTVSAWEGAKLDEDAASSEEIPDSDLEEQPASGRATTGSGEGAAERSAETWAPRTRLWSGVPLAADDRVVIITSRGVVTPSGKVVTGRPMPSGEALGAFLVNHWSRDPKRLPQLWLTYEALEAIGFPTDVDPEEFDAADAVAATFGCEVSYAKSGWFTCRFTNNGGRKAYVVLIPLMYLDPSPKRPGDMGVAGWEDTETELPEGELEAIELLADRIGWLATLADGIAPSSRWANVGADLLDAVRRRGRQSQKGIDACPLPVEVAVESGGELEPVVEPQWDKRPHRPREGRIDVEVDQRAAYLASAGQVELGFGKPKEVQRIDVEVFAEQRPPFGLWRLTTPPCSELDGLTKRLPRPHAGMQWDRSATFWLTTRGVQQLTAPVELGGAGLSIAELAIDEAWVWPQQGRLLRTWAEELRVKLIEAQKSERGDYQDFIKAIYTTYLGRMASAKWQPSQKHHQQPTWYATIRADTRWRAMKYARRIADTYNLYPVSADLDAWIYLVEPDQELTMLTEESSANGKYRVKWTSADDTTEGEAEQ